MASLCHAAELGVVISLHRAGRKQAAAEPHFWPRSSAGSERAALERACCPCTLPARLQRCHRSAVKVQQPLGHFSGVAWRAQMCTFAGKSPNWLAGERAGGRNIHWRHPRPHSLGPLRNRWRARSGPAEGFSRLAPAVVQMSGRAARPKVASSGEKLVPLERWRNNAHAHLGQHEAAAAARPLLWAAIVGGCCCCACSMSELVQHLFAGATDAI